MERLTPSPPRTRSGAVDWPAGSFTVNNTGHLVISTLPQRFPAPLAQAIGRRFLELFRASLESPRPFTELRIEFGGLSLTARALRSGALVFLEPRPPKPASTSIL